METLRTILIFIICIAIMVAIFYGIWKLGISITYKRTGKATDEILLRLYDQTAYNKRLTMGIILFVVLGLVGIFLYYLLKKQHAIYEEELKRRQVQFLETP